VGHLDPKTHHSKELAIARTIRVVAFSKVVVAAWAASSIVVAAEASNTAGSELTSTWPAVVTCIAIVGWVDTKVPAVGIKVVEFPSYSVVRCPS
jgi:hypothetical protein